MLIRNLDGLRCLKLVNELHTHHDAPSVHDDVTAESWVMEFSSPAGHLVVVFQVFVTDNMNRIYGLILKHHFVVNVHFAKYI